MLLNKANGVIVQLTYLYRGYRELDSHDNENENSGDRDNQDSHDSGDNSHDSGDNKDEEEEEEYDPASDMAFPVMMVGSVYGKSVMAEVKDLCGLSQCQAHSIYNMSDRRPYRELYEG